MARGNTRGHQRVRGRFPSSSVYAGSGVLYGGHYLRRVAERMGDGSAIQTQGNRYRGSTQGVFGRGAEYSKNYRYYENPLPYRRPQQTSYVSYGSGSAHNSGQGRYMSMQRQMPYGKGISQGPSRRFTRGSRGGARGGFVPRGRGAASSRGGGRGRGGRGAGGRGGRGRGRGGGFSKETLDTELDKYMGDDNVKGRLDAQLDTYFSRDMGDASNEIKQDGDVTMEDASAL